MKSKKLLSLLLALSLVATLLVGCGNQPATTPANDTPNNEATDGAVKTGLSMITSVSNSKDASAEKAGLAQSNIALVAVTVDDNGVIDSCVIDAIQAKINFGTDGVITTDPATTFASKNDLGTDYGMTKASSIGKEWNEQAAAMAAYVVGKTVDEVKAIAVDDSGKATDADLSASVTLSIGSFVAGIEDAVNKAAHLGAKKGDTLKLSSVTNMAKSKNASADGDGLAQAYATVAAITLSENTITSCYIDAVQANVNFNTAGTITSDIAAAVDSKNTLGDNYGMRKASSIGKEWNEQAAAFCRFVTGKTVSDVAAIAVDDDGHTTDADLVTSCTVGVDEFQLLIANAAK